MYVSVCVRVCSSQSLCSKGATVGAKRHMNCSDSKHQHPCHNTTGSPPSVRIDVSGQTYIHTRALPHKHTRLQSAAEIC